MEETGVQGENNRLVASHWQTLSHNVISSTTSPWTGFELTTLEVIGTDCTYDHHHDDPLKCKQHECKIDVDQLSDLVFTK